MMNIKYLTSDQDLSPELTAWCESNDVDIVQDAPEDTQLALRWSDDRLSLTFPSSKQGDVFVEFAGGAAQHRRKHGGGYGQPVAKALGLAAWFQPHILDLTAGLGRDAFVMASLGAKVTMYERNPIVALLLADGLRRGLASEPEVAEICDRMTLVADDSHKEQLPSADIVYLDPMFPERQKAAAVKKDMAAFHQVVGMDDDADELLERALAVAKYRVVVKRPKHAPYLKERKPSTELKGKSGRFDIYALKGIKKGAA